MAKAKKKNEKLDAPVETKAVETGTEETYPTMTFSTRDGSEKVTMNEPVKGNKASQVVFEVLKMADGKVGDGMRLQFAPSYKAHFIARRGKNACGASTYQNLLVVNGIAEELEAAGVKGIIQPTAKPFKALKVGKMNSKELKALARKIATVLGLIGGAKKAPKEKVAEETVPIPDPVVEMKAEEAEVLAVEPELSLEDAVTAS